MYFFNEGMAPNQINIGYICESCDKQFRTYSHYRIHKLTQHEN